MTTITHAMAHRLAVGMELRKHAEPQTVRAIASATGLIQTDVYNALREMLEMQMVKRVGLNGYRERQEKSSNIGWLYVEQAT